MYTLITTFHLIVYKSNKLVILSNFIECVPFYINLPARNKFDLVKRPRGKVARIKVQPTAVAILFAST